MLLEEYTADSNNIDTTTQLPREPLLITSMLASIAGAAIYLFGFPALWRMSWFYGLLFLALGLGQIGIAIALLIRPSRQKALFTAALAFVVILLWALVRLIPILPAPDPWIAIDWVIGFTDYICITLELLAVVGLLIAMTFRLNQSLAGKVTSVSLSIPLMIIVLVGGFVGVDASSNQFVGAGLPADTITDWQLPSGQMSTVEYCRPESVPLAMDIYMPTVGHLDGTPAPIVLYVHGGGVWGSRQMRGLGSQQANHQGALFNLLQEQLNAAGFVVAAIDYRLPPATPWPAQIEDVKCAVRSLRAHADSLHIDPDRMGVWGSSFGGYLVSMLALTESQYNTGQYIDESSSVQAVVDMFGPANLEAKDDISPFAQLLVKMIFGNSTSVYRDVSPINYVTPDAPPFIILHGTADDMVSFHQSVVFTSRLQDAGVPVTYIEVEGAGHSLVTPGENPKPDELTNTIVSFFVDTLR